jgi:hypothetical protein
MRAGGRVTDTLVRPEPVTLDPTLLAPIGRVDRRAMVRKTNRKQLVVPLLIMGLTAWMITSFWVSVDTRSPRAPFPAPTAGQPWIRSPGPGPHAYFRLTLPVASIPQSATLWLTADQAAIPFVNGVDMASTPRVQTYNGTYVPRVVETLDIRPALVAGKDVVGLEVINYDNRPPAFEARISIRTGGLTQVFGVSPSDWQSTTNVALTGQVLPRSGAFASPTFTPDDWVPATSAGSRIGATSVSAAPASYTQPTNGEAIVGQSNGHQLTASTTVVFPSGCSDGWLRVAANGPYTVALDGQTFASGTGTWQVLGVPTVTGWNVDPLQNTIPLTIYDLCPVESSGRQRLSVSVSSTSAPIVYLDGQVGDGRTVTHFQTGPEWTASGSAKPNLVANPEQLLDATFQKTTGTTDVPAGPLLARTAEIFIMLFGLGCAVALVGGLVGSGRRRALSAVVAGLLPALGLVVILTEMRHFVGVQPPFPSTPFLLHVVLVLAGGGIVTSMAVTLLPARRRAAALSADNGEPLLAHAAVRTATPSKSVKLTWIRSHRYGLGIVGIALFWTLALSYRIDYQPLWQDELSSMAAAQGISAHLLPRWPSGFLYWKSELYSALLAVVGTLTHYRTSWLRELSTLWFGATVLLFGFRLIPLVVRRRSFQFAGTLVFASAVLEQTHAQEVRMYQMVQFFVVLLAVVLLKAVREPTTARIAGVMVVTVSMYLTHEESFGVLLLLPVALFGFLGFRWCRDWRWWVFGGLAGLCIATQVALAELTHPPAFGVDLSGGPLVQWSPQPFYYLVNVFFTPGGPGPALTVVSILAVIGTVIAWRKRDRTLLYLAAFWIIPAVIVSLFLPAKNPRYVFLTLPFVFILATRACSEIFMVLRTAMTSRERGISHSLRLVLSVVLAAACGLAVMMSTVGSLSDYGPLSEALVGADVQHFNLDYPNAVGYVKAHEARGDAVLAVGPANLTGQSLGRAPTYWVSANRTQTLLYVFEKNNQVVDTEYGIPVLLNADEFEAAIDGHYRDWLVVADQNVARLIPSVKAIVESRFRLVYEGESVSVFLCTN